MPIDDERREVARKLREPEDQSDELCRIICDAVFGDHECHFTECGDCEELTRNRLADLIGTGIPVDPGEAGLASVDGFIRERTGKPVDRDALLALADELDESLAWMDGDEPVAVLESSLRDVSRRIREACGEG